MKKLALIAVFATALTVLIIGGTSSLAATGNYTFNMTRGNTYQSSSVIKSDGENKAYITVTGSNLALNGSDVYGLRVRNSSGVAATSYRIFNWNANKDTLSYLSGQNISNRYYTLRGQIDSSSAYNQLTIGGRWTP